MEQLIKQLAHALGSLDVRMRFGDILRFLHPGPGQEEGEVLVDVPNRESDRLAGLGIRGYELDVVGDDHEACAVAHDAWGRLQFLQHFQGVPCCLLEVDDLLLRDLTSLVSCDVQIAVAQASDAALRLSVGEQEIEDELAVVRLTTGEWRDALFDGFQI
ncbi:hypothetical protein AHiyo8_02320 [Arthrobacter sp. Hiyo8]|nr:hypothetical protein AHiyo8_02320 [Arthrobacter sp. Hiyo8]